MLLTKPFCVFEGDIGPEGQRWRVVISKGDEVVVETRTPDSMGGDCWVVMDPVKHVYALKALEACALEKMFHKDALTNLDRESYELRDLVKRAVPFVGNDAHAQADPGQWLKDAAELKCISG